ncbi:hypothetical protein VPH35_000923 [Triticum aestivum]
MEDAGMEFLLDAVDRFPLLEEFTDSHEQPDPAPLAYSSASSECGQQVGGDCNDAARAGVHRRHKSSPARSTQSTYRINPQAPGWTKMESQRWRIAGRAGASVQP